MARNAYISSPPGFGAIQVSPKTQYVDVTCEWDYNGADDHVRIGFLVETSNPPAGTIHWYDTSSGRSPGYWRDGYEYIGGGPETMTCDGGTAGSLSRRGALNCDTTYYARSVIDYWADYDETSYTRKTSSIISFKTYPIPFVCAAPATSSETTVGATVDFTYYPNTVESTASVSLQYKKSSDSTWNTYVTYTSQSGYSGVPKTVVMTGLDAGTQYNVRVSATRTTASDTSFTSATSSFTTLPGVPIFETRAATSVSHNSATLNARVTGGSLPVDISFQWDSDGSGAPYANTTSPAETVSVLTGEGYTDVSFVIEGLSDSTQHWFRAKAVYNGGSDTSYEDELSFTTAGNPIAESVNEEHMQTIQFDGQYGSAKTVTFTLRKPAGTSSDLFYTSTAPVQADCLIYKDGAYDSTSDNAPTQVSTYLYKLVLSATEMQCETLDLVIHDADALTFRDAHIQVRTAQRLSELDVDATNGPTNATAVTAIGNGTGHGVYATSAGTGNDIDAIVASQFLRVATVGANSSGTSQQLDASASGTDDFYNGCILVVLSGTGAGQARIITNYVGSSKVATMDEAFAVGTVSGNSVFGILPGARPWAITVDGELTAVPSFTAASYGKMLQLLFQRFAMKITQDGTTQSWYNTSNSAWASRTVGDTGTEQTVGNLS